MGQAAATEAAVIVVGGAIEAEATQQAEITPRAGATTSKRIMGRKYESIVFWIWERILPKAFAACPGYAVRTVCEASER